MNIHYSSIHRDDLAASPMMTVLTHLGRNSVEALSNLVTVIQSVAQSIIDFIKIVFAKIQTFFQPNGLTTLNGLEPSMPNRSRAIHSHLSIHTDEIITPKSMQIIYTERGITIIKKAPSIKNLALQGGGMRGFVYPTFLKVLDQELGLLDSLQEVSGSSAGAMMALMLAIGLSPEEIEIFLKEHQHNILQQLINYGSHHLELGQGFLPAGELADTFQDVARKSACSYFNQIKERVDLWESLIVSQEAANFIQHGQQGFEGGVTFEDLAFLHKLNPQKFKLLHVTAFDRDHQQTIYFNARNYPHVPCHLAVRASMAIPGLVKSVIIDGKSLTDGGEGSNMPLEVFSGCPGYKPEETMALTFLRGEEADEILHYPAKKGSWHGPQTSIWAMAVSTHLAKAEKADAHKIYDLGPNVLIVPHGNLGLFSFNADVHRLEMAKAQAEQDARQYAALRKHLAVHEVYAYPPQAS